MLRGICCCLDGITDSDTDDSETDARSSAEPPPAYSSLPFGGSYGTISEQVGSPERFYLDKTSPNLLPGQAADCGVENCPRSDSLS
jgi:hypothetical protein